MPAGLLLSPTARTVRSGPGREPSRRRCRRPQVPLPRRQERPAARLGKVPWELSPSPSRAVRRRGCGCGAFRSYRPQSRLTPRPSPARWLGQRHGHRTPHPLQGPAMASLPCLERHASFLPCPLTGVSLPVSSCAPCRKRSSPCFPLPDLLRSGASVPPLPGQKIVRSTSIFPAIPAPLCKEK